MITDEVCEEDSRNKVEAEESRENKGCQLWTDERTLGVVESLLRLTLVPTMSNESHL